MYRKMRDTGDEMSEMIATANAKSIEINPFSRQKETYKCHTKPTRLTENGSVCSAALPTR